MTLSYGCSPDRLAVLDCLRVPPVSATEGRLDSPPWTHLPRSHRFVDLVNGTPGLLDTRVMACWDEHALHIGFWVEEPNVQARLTERDSLIWTENDVEIFLGGEDCYYEFEINALGTVYEVFYVWQDAYSGSRFARDPRFDLVQRNVDVLGGFQDALRYRRHPRGKRWAFMDYDFPGLKTAVHVDGNLNNPMTVDRGWTVEVSFPWEGFTDLLPSRTFPPRPGDTLRADFSRFEALSCNGQTVNPSLGWALNEHGLYDSHIPECFSILRFTEETPEGSRP